MSDSLFVLTWKVPIDTIKIKEEVFWINQWSSFFKSMIRKKRMEFFEPAEKEIHFGILTKKRLWFLRTQRALSRQTKEGNPVEFLRFHVYNSIHPITTGMNLIRNMNHKRKCLLNRSQEYQLQYLLSKEESFQ